MEVNGAQQVGPDILQNIFFFQQNKEIHTSLLQLINMIKFRCTDQKLKRMNKFMHRQVYDYH